ncbi:MAG: hypothetical protein Q8K24_02185 [Hydrogenophaga sp.]|nr:hypothetical protein [Hydrogenophaga sp.]
MTIKPSSRLALLCAALLLNAGVVQAQPSTMPDNATTVPPEMGVKPPLPGASGPRAADLKPRMRPELKPRMKSDELIPEMRSEQRPEMSPGMQPNSQKPLRTDANIPRGGSPAN